MEVILKEPSLTTDHEEGGEINEMIGDETLASDWKFRKPSSPDQKESIDETQEDQIEFTRAKICEVKEENERLKTVLAQIVKEYQALQMQLFGISQKKDHQEQAKNKPLENSTLDHQAEEPELVELSLGTSPSTETKKKNNGGTKEEDHQMRSGLTLGLEYCSYVENSSSDNCSSEKGEAMDQAVERWPPSKMLKSDLRRDDDEVAAAHTTNVKRARVSVRARCDAPTMNDGCQWRKYGQKVSKGNPCPRAYYRCTVAPGCPVRKQVQRCMGDMSILITTYEGTHNHPLPVSAAAMASTTSAAASMLTSGPSPPRSSTAAGSSFSSTTNFQNFNSSHPNQFYLSNRYIPSPSSSSSSHPTITLDLTPSYSLTSTSITSNAHIKNQYLYPSSSSQSYWHRAASSALGYPPVTNTIAKAITSDPGFQSVLAAAINSYVGAQGAQGRQEGSEAPMMKFGSAVSLPSWPKSATASASPVDDRKQSE